VGWVCCGAGAGAAAGAAFKAGAVFAGSSAAGFWAVWQDETDRARTASIAIRIWSFATRIFLYEIRITPWDWSPRNSIKNRTSRLTSGQRRKAARLVTFGTRANGSPKLTYSDV